MIEGVDGETFTIAFVPVGALGTAADSNAADGWESAPVPAAFVAVTRNECSTPLASPEISQMVPVVVQERSGEVVERTRYPVIAEPLAGAGFQDTIIEPVWFAEFREPKRATTSVGAPGAP
ncbi:unannotated protein [freshwater metagenome]|uniref:Unannotated protein n=1 Tax=freshwater metagenome TaxID=449393 RepID=A0A6J5YG68_9ZZZZ